MDSIELAAPAKINLVLELVSKRADGYHELKMLMSPINIFDTVKVSRTPKSGEIELICKGSPHVESGPTNICHRAAQFFFEKTSVTGGVLIEITKRIPSGAGMGGGSSDAASTILGMEKIFQTVLGEKAKQDAAFEVGADVPFFFAEAPAWVEGIGEKVSPVAFDEVLWLVVVHPGVILSTAAVFSRSTIGLTTPSPVHTITQFNFRGILDGLRNDLAQAASQLAPEIALGEKLLIEAHAEATLMTGSGSAVFGLFGSPEEAEKACDEIKRRVPASWLVRMAQTLGPARTGKLR